ncbi:hypothetical protein A0J61_11649 [Choanephora cucurbitarum]|uniref:Uncharacterized protein n=1 Tax=Choanephora cucurbitarum TaxID=101091 RepID=A0A1C7MTZ6_9FUNG|nr:hypothetical protein A0J61_11649 [Choanephora cucurbitarum]
MHIRVKVFVASVVLPREKYKEKELKEILKKISAKKDECAINITSQNAHIINNIGVQNNVCNKKRKHNHVDDGVSQSNYVESINNDTASNNSCTSSTTNGTGSAKTDIWVKWCKFLDASKNNRCHKYSLPKHRIIRGGAGISSKPSLDERLYKKHMKKHERQEFVLPQSCQAYVNAVVEAVSFI